MTETDASMLAATTTPEQRLSARTIVRRRGRRPAEFWVSFTTMDEPYKARAAPCRHCSATVNYHKKWEQAKSHLLKCEPFLKLMQATDVHCRPEWFAAEVEKRRHSAVRLMPIDLVVRGGTGSASDSGGTTTVAFKPSITKEPSRVKKKQSLGGNEKLTTSELLVLQALHTGSSVDPAFLRHVLTRGPDSARESLHNILEKVYQRVQRCVDSALRASSGTLPILCIHWDTTAQAVEFFVAKDEKCFFIERTTVPDTAQDMGNPASAVWLKGQVQRVVQALGVRVHRCTLNAPTESVQRVIALWDQEVADIQMHPSPLRAIVEMANDILVSAMVSDTDANPLTGLLPVALTCIDALRILGVHTPMPAYIGQQLDMTRRIVDGLRSLTLADAFWGIVDATQLLDTDAVVSLVEQAHLDIAACENFYSQLNQPFVSQVRRFHAVLEPLATAIAATNACVVYPSDAFVAFASLQKTYRDSECLTNVQKQFLLDKLGKYEECIVQLGYTQAHLLDPAYLGELFEVAAKATAEHALLAMDPIDKQALYVEYTQFQVAIVQQHHASSDGFVLRMLKARKKTMLQYWLTDGRRWPRLQAIALGMEQTPADAGVVSQAESKHQVLPPGSWDAEKEMYVLRNTPLFSLTELATVKPQGNNRSGSPPMETEAIDL